jgi:putative tryptophan/tyrosine transport system substrate-binding protein
MRRREFITLAGSAAAAWSLAARAQQPDKMHRIGFLTLSSGPSPSIEGFQSGLSQLGYVEGQNVIIIYRWAAGRKDRLVDLAKELLQLKVDLFASQSTEAIIAIRSINETIRHDHYLRPDRQQTHSQFCAAGRKHHWCDTLFYGFGNQASGFAQGGRA